MRIRHSKQEKMVLEICEMLGLPIERTVTMWGRAGIRTKKKGMHFFPFKEFWFKKEVLNKVHDFIVSSQDKPPHIPAQRGKGD